MASFLITGADGMLGSEFRALAQESFHGQRIHPRSHLQLDILDFAAIRRSLTELRPDILINCAAYRDVDKAETDTEAASRVNVEGPLLLAKACREAGVKLVHFGTHGIFDGAKVGPYLESDPPRPLNHYARTKWEGEQAVLTELPGDQCLVLRIAWPYARRGNNFIRIILDKARSLPEIKVVADHVAVPSPAKLLAVKTLEIASEASGLLHLSCTGNCSRHELMTFLFDRLGVACRALPVKAEEFPSPAPRPKNMAIATERREWAERLAMPDWKKALVEFIEQDGFEI